jgi:hypothetical protein
VSAAHFALAITRIDEQQKDEIEMNRQQRRAAKAKGRETISQIDSTTCDIQVEGKIEKIVVICANSKGRKVVEDLCPDVEWTTDEFFSSVHSHDWRFTHVRVTRLPPYLEAQVPFAFASPDELGFAVACALQRRTEPMRVVYRDGPNRFDERFDNKPGTDVASFAEHVPAGTVIGAPEGVH